MDKAERRNLAQIAKIELLVFQISQSFEGVEHLAERMTPDDEHMDNLIIKTLEEIANSRKGIEALKQLYG